MSSPTSAFAVNWDYRCPFARNAHEHVIAGLRAGAPWDVTFVAFSLNQVHVPEDGMPVWDNPKAAPALLAMQVGIVVRDRHPEQFLDVHGALFVARHDESRDITSEEVLREILSAHGVDADSVFAEIVDGWPLMAFRKEHEEWADGRQVFGVPTFVVGDSSVFIRFMHRPEGDGAVGRGTIDRAIELLGWAELNEFKHTTTAR